MAARYHVPEFEMHIHLVKERMWVVYGRLPCDRMNSRMIIELGNYVVIMINAFPPKSGIPWTYSPRNIINFKQLYFKKQCPIPFGTYIQSHYNWNTENQMIDRTQGDICLGPTGNLQGSYTFLSLRTRRKATHSQFKKLPTSSRITQRVTSMKIHKKNTRACCLRDVMGWNYPW